MMSWFKKTAPEKRASQPYTDAIVSALITQAGGSDVVNPAALGALEIAAGLWSRAFASASVLCDDPRVKSAITPEVLGMVGRWLIKSGEMIFLIEFVSGEIVLSPVGSHDVRGGHLERDQYYRIDVFGASEHTTKYVGSDAVVHAKYAVDPAIPYIGVAPLDFARSTGALAAALELRLGQEAAAEVGYLMPIPQSPDGDDVDDDDNNTVSLQKDMARLKGKTMLVETTSSGWGESKESAPRQDYVSKRFGGMLPESNIELRNAVTETILACCGVPVELATLGTGTASREAFRRFLHSSCSPVAKMAEYEISKKMGAEVKLDFSQLYAADIASKSRALSSFVKSGMELDRALALSGLLTEDE